MAYNLFLLLLYEVTFSSWKSEDTSPWHLVTHQLGTVIWSFTFYLVLHYFSPWIWMAEGQFGKHYSDPGDTHGWCCVFEIFCRTLWNPVVLDLSKKNKMLGFSVLFFLWPKQCPSLLLKKIPYTVHLQQMRMVARIRICFTETFTGAKT